MSRRQQLRATLPREGPGGALAGWLSQELDDPERWRVETIGPFRVGGDSLLLAPKVSSEVR